MLSGQLCSCKDMCSLVGEEEGEEMIGRGAPGHLGNCSTRHEQRLEEPQYHTLSTGTP